MRFALFGAVITVIALSAPSMGLAGSTCSDCPELVDSGFDLTTQGVIVAPRFDPPVNRYEEAALQRILLVTQAKMGGSEPTGDTGGGFENPGLGTGGGAAGVEVTPGPVPEPATGLLAALGLVGLAIGRRLKA